jgi:hypothetical protein
LWGGFREVLFGAEEEEEKQIPAAAGKHKPRMDTPPEQKQVPHRRSAKAADRVRDDRQAGLEASEKQSK